MQPSFLDRGLELRGRAIAGGVSASLGWCCACTDASLTLSSFLTSLTCWMAAGAVGGMLILRREMNTE